MGRGYQLSLHDRERHAHAKRDQYWRDSAYRLACINRSRARAGLAPACSLDDVRHRGPRMATKTATPTLSHADRARRRGKIIAYAREHRFASSYCIAREFGLHDRYVRKILQDAGLSRSRR